jgi:CheY-like chemotaxis protein
VLVVDDDPDVRESVAALLEEEGFEVVDAENGRDALHTLEKIPLPCLALVDLRMPVMDGVELIERLRKDARFDSMPVVAFSAATTVEPPAGVMLLRKPVGIDALLGAIKDSCRV